jgi:uncharacterized membrane protein YqjE
MQMRNGAADPQASIGSLFRELSRDISTLVRSEVALAKVELKETATALGGAAAMIGAALFLALFGLGFLLVTAVLALSMVIPAWLSSLIIALLLLAVAAVLALSGKKKLQTVNFVPTETIESVKADVESIKSEFGRARRS